MRLEDANPITGAEADRWAASDAGTQARDRTMDRIATDAVPAEEPRPARRVARLLVPALVLAVVAVTVVVTRGDGDPSPGPVGTVPPGCPVTVPSAGFVPPEPHGLTPPEEYASAWYGSDALWTMLPTEGRPFAATGDKVFYWSDAFDRDSEDFLAPDLTVTATPFDGTDDEIRFEDADNGMHNVLGTFMVTGAELPPGCWTITAEYRGAALSHVVWVEG